MYRLTYVLRCSCLFSFVRDSYLSTFFKSGPILPPPSVFTSFPSLLLRCFLLFSICRPSPSSILPPPSSSFLLALPPPAILLPPSFAPSFILPLSCLRRPPSALHLSFPFWYLWFGSLSFLSFAFLYFVCDLRCESQYPMRVGGCV